MTLSEEGLESEALKFITSRLIFYYHYMQVPIRVRVLEKLWDNTYVL
jgi:hypothetical protein